MDYPPRTAVEENSQAEPRRQSVCDAEDRDREVMQIPWGSLENSE